ncbi:hypothetical protein [Cupriavidus pinatubonensis]|nr:hypothetical protein [Cupriavidus pinatubonensis]
MMTLLSSTVSLARFACEHDLNHNQSIFSMTFAAVPRGAKTSDL